MWNFGRIELTVPQISYRIVLSLFSLAIVLILLSCTPSHPQSTFDAAGPIAKKQLELFWIVFAAAVVVFVVVEAVLLYALFRFRRRGINDPIPPQVHGNTRMEIAWTIAPAIILAAIAIPTVIYIFDIAKTPDNALEINVIGHQWWWEFEYPEYDVVTANEFYVPVKRPIKLNLTSDDVIHSFWLPKLAGKVDVVPSNTNTLNFVADHIGTYIGQCAEFCGEAHAFMRVQVVVESEPGFERWISKYHEIAARKSPI